MTGGRLLLFFLVAGVPSAAAGCSGCHHPSAPVVDAAPVSSEPDVTQLQFLDAGDEGDAAAEAEAGRRSVNPVPPNKLTACCNALRAEAKKLGNSPEAFQLNTLAGQCDQAVKGNAPELAGLFAILKSKNVPECKALP